jgi:GTPase SAR1 family protein
MKSISLLMGEQVYQGGTEKTISYYGVLPFPDLNLMALTYFFLIPDETARGKAKASTISMLTHDTHANFLYENMKQLSIFLAAPVNLFTAATTPEEYQDIMQNLFDTLSEYSNDVIIPRESKRTLKILFTGLDSSGKTSYLRAVKQQYSKLFGIKPTKGIVRNEIEIFGQNLVEWDIGGQERYREMFLKQADLYLYDTNLLFYLVDVRDEPRYEDALDFFRQITTILRAFKQFVPIVINFNKLDPDISQENKYKTRLIKLKKRFTEIGEDFKISFFETSIFATYSLIKSFSNGITSLSPNRDLFKSQLRWLAGNIKADSLIIINENSIILSEYAKDKASGAVAEISAPHFQNLFRTFSDFKMLKENSAIWKMEHDQVMFYKLLFGKRPYYVLCMANIEIPIKNEFEKNLGEFRNRIDPLIETYL